MYIFTELNNGNKTIYRLLKLKYLSIKNLFRCFLNILEGISLLKTSGRDAQSLYSEVSAASSPQTPVGPGEKERYNVVR